MSAINTSVSRATTRPRQGARQSADRNRAPGSTGIADADQRGQGVLGFPQTGTGPLARLFPNRFGAGQAGQAGQPAGPTVPLTGEPVATPEQVGSAVDVLSAGGGVGPAGLATLETLSPAQIAAIEESGRVANASNEITQQSMGILGGAAPGGSPEAQRLRELLLQDPVAISEEVQNAAISKATDSILGAQRGAQQGLQENLAARGISDSGLSFALAQGGQEAAGRGIAEARRDVLLQAGLAQSQREVQQQQLLLNRTGQIEPIGLRIAEGQAGLNQLTEVPAASFGDIAADNALAAVEATANAEDDERQVDDFMATIKGGVAAFLVGLLTRKIAG